MESVATESNTFEEELEQEEVTAENWNGGYDEEGDYTGAGEYDESGNYVGPKALSYSPVAYISVRKWQPLSSAHHI